MSDRRLRIITENFLGADLFQHGLPNRSTSTGRMRSSWEYRKSDYGHLRMSLSPCRQSPSCMSSGATATMQTFRVSKLDGRRSNHVDQQNKVFSTIENFVDYFAEDPSKARYIKKILVATNGIAAVKCILSMRKLLMQLFKEDHIIKFICLTTEQEIQSKAEYLKMADYIVFSPAGANTNNYANVDEIVEHAVRNKVDAVWAGWGHASENPRLPDELNRRNIAFLGPPGKAMFALGDKIASTIIAQTVGIPTIEWSGSGLVVPPPSPSVASDGVVEEEVCVPENVYMSACVSSVREGLAALREKNIAYPVMIKASEGGGGKGIRKCNNDDEFRLNFRRVQAEVPGSPIFLMKCMINARHIEVQLIGDQYGNVIPIYTRDCSIQRRCQKIIEEAPASVVPEHILYQMEQDAVNLAKRVGYVSAGTVEYMYTPDEQKYYFLELNPRLQVEHPCTEMVSNINIPAVQLQVAMGIPLHRIVEIRLFFGMDRYGTSSLPENQIRTDTNICVIAARITSEDPAEGFRPASGSVEVLNFHSNQNVWGYFSVASTGKVHEYADSQFGHLFAKGTTRYEAISALLCALKELELRATFASQVNYLVGLLHDEEFENNIFHTGWLDTRIAAKVQSMPELPIHVAVAVGATVIGHARISEVFSKFQSALERGQILPKSELTETWQVELVHNNVKYGVLVNRFGPINFLVSLNGSETFTEVRELGNGTLLVTYSDLAYTCHLEEEAERFKVCIGKTMTIFEKENDPSMLRSVNAGRLLQFLKKDGEYVSVGDVFAEIESMKMVINLEVRKAGGRLVQVAQPGQVLFPGTLIARLDDQDASQSQRPTVFCDRMVEWDEAQELLTHATIRLNSKYENVIQSCRDVMNGYSVPEMVFKRHTERLLNDLFTVLRDGKLPYALFKVMLNVVESRISRMSTYDRIKELIRDELRPFPAAQLTEEMENYLSTVDPADVGIEKQYFEALLRICERFEGGLEGHMKIVFTELLEAFLDIETYFQEVSYDTGVSAVKANDPNLTSVVRKIYSHTQVLMKNAFLCELIFRLDQPMVLSLQPILKKLANLFNPEIESLALCVRQVLNKMHETSYGDVCSNMTRNSSERSLSDLVALCSTEGGDVILKNFVNANGEGDLILHEFFFTSNAETNRYAIKLFIKRNFHVPDNDIEVLPSESDKALIFKFVISPSTPMYSGHKQRPRVHRKLSASPSGGVPSATTPGSIDSGKFVYYLSVLSELDLLRHEHLIQTLKNNHSKDANNTFLFVAYPRGENGFNKAIGLPESELRALSRELRNEVGKTLSASGVCAQAVDLMLSRPAHPPLYAQYDFSAKEKLELYRLPPGAEDIITRRAADEPASSPYLLFRLNDHGIMRIFARCLLRDVSRVFQPAEKYSLTGYVELLKNKLIDLLDGACGEIRVSSAADKTPSAMYDCNHILICLDFDPSLNTDGWWAAAEQAIKNSERFLVKHKVTKVEITYQESRGAAAGVPPETIRIVYINDTGAIPEIFAYKVVDDKLCSLSKGRAPQAGQSCYAPHRSIPNVAMQKKRYQASKTGTTYVYDFPIMFGQAVLNMWKTFEFTDPVSYAKIVSKDLPTSKREALESLNPSAFVRACEMVLRGDSNGVSDADDANTEFLVIRDDAELERRLHSGENDRGMVAWEIELWTPEAPHGRKIVVISNDITYKIGSFSMREHRLYYKASEYSRKHKMPRIYLAANSGARIGFAMDVKERLNVEWNDPEKPEDGFRYLSIDCNGDDDAVLNQIEFTKIVNGKTSYRIDAVVGQESDIGVENLVGSGLIAGETSAAYREVPTYCLVTGRAVGIGAYAARLSHRICQVESSHLILTGALALNSILGREIYTSNAQLGGPQIMYRNGVSHAVARTDLEGIQTIVKWISYLPTVSPTNASDLMSSLTMLKDDFSREVKTLPSKSAYDPRMVLDPPEGGGFFDRGTFDEIMAGWAKTIIVGRARLRGLSVGVVAVETRTVECEIPADPAQEDSQSRVIHQAGQVWHSNSAYKTAEAINDFNNEGLPLIVVANIRGFSGGQKDMFEMVLKFGACIVDALQSYTQPIVVYIPPYGELRGGAWAVLDTKINPTCITMLADPESRGGVIEPSGIVEIKFRQRDLEKLMVKTDEKLRRWKTIADDKAADDSIRKDAKREIAARVELLTPIFKTAVTKFADLHDTTARMLAKGAIDDEVAWRNSRDYIFDLLTVESAKMSIARRYLQAAGLCHATTSAEPAVTDAATRVTIDELAIGYAWAEAHLASVKVSTRLSRSRSAGDDNTDHTRYIYRPQPVCEYANSAQFERVIAQIDLNRTKNAFLNKLKYDDDAKQVIVREILATSTEAARESVLLNEINTLGAEERKRLIDALVKQSKSGGR